jgi:uncharacterized protein
VKKILTIDGGGIMGIIPAYLCAKLEESLGKPLNQVFDLMCGTSTGAIISACLAKGVPAKEILDLYVNNAKTIFKPNQVWYKPWTYLTEPKYDRSYLTNMLESKLGGTTLLGELPIKYMCTSYNILEGKNEFFSSWEPKYKKLKLTKAVNRSWAAPYYFGKIIERTPINAIYSDGGIGQFNTMGLKSALCSHRLGWNDEIVHITDMGCGKSSDLPSFDDAVTWMNIKEVANTVLLNRVNLQRQGKEFEDEFLKSDLCRNIIFDSYNIEVDKKYDKLDGIEFIEFYLKCGELIWKEFDVNRFL